MLPNLAQPSQAKPSPSMTQVNPTHILDLPSEILVDILRCLRLPDVPAVAATCRAFHRLLFGASASQVLWRCLHGNGLASDEARRCLPIMQLGAHCDCGQCTDPVPVYREQLRAGAAWYRGRPTEATVVSCRRGQQQQLPMMPCLQLHGSRLIYSWGPSLRCRRLNGCFIRRRNQPGLPAYPGTAGADVTTLSASPASGCALVGTADGRLLLWPAGQRPRTLARLADDVITCLDSREDGLVLAGAKTGDLCAARLSQGAEMSSSADCMQLCWSLSCSDRVLSCRLLSGGSTALVGCAGIPSEGPGRPLRLLDTESGRCLSGLSDSGLDRRGSGIRAIALAAAPTAVTVGYDTGVRVWDLRVPGGGPALRWDDPHDCAGTAVQADQGHTVLVGLMGHGLVRLYDTRQGRAHVRSFFKGAHYPDCVARLTRSPVYSLDFNMHCFARGLDTEVNVVSFA